MKPREATSLKRVEWLISVILWLGILVSLLLVASGGCWYLLQYGTQHFQDELTRISAIPYSLPSLLARDGLLAPLTLIQCGLYALALTQLLRVALLAGFYIFNKEAWFIIISLFITAVLACSLLVL